MMPMSLCLSYWMGYMRYAHVCVSTVCMYSMLSYIFCIYLLYYSSVMYTCLRNVMDSVCAVVEALGNSYFHLTGEYTFSVRIQLLVKYIYIQRGSLRAYK